MIGSRARYVIDWGIIISTGGLLMLGVINLYSATYQGESSKVFYAQLGWMMVGLVMMVFVVILDYRIFERLAYVLYGIVLLMLVAVLVVGTSAMGAKRWLSFGPINMQPSDPMKIMLILALAKFFHNQRKEDAYSLRELIIPIILVGIPFGLV